MSTDDIQDTDEIEDTEEIEGADALPLRLHVDPQDPTWLIGTPFPVDVTMTNTGAGAIEVPDPNGPSPFVYDLNPQDPTGIARALSERSARLALRPDARRQPPVQLVSLAAGAKQQLHEDLGDYLVEPTPAGSYALRAVYQPPQGPALQSTPVPVRLRAPEPSHLVHAAAPSIPFVSTAFVEAGGDGPQVLYLREVVSDGHALVGSAYPLPVPDDGAIEQLAVSISDGPAQYFRWVAWRVGDTVHAGFAQSWSPRLVDAPAEPALRELALSPVGWQYGVAEAEFAALGLGDDGRPMLATMAFFVEDGDRAELSLAPTGLDDLPSAWTLARSSGRGAKARYRLVAASRTDTGLAVDGIALGGATPGPAVALHRGDGPLAAMAVSATPAASKPFVDLLLGPTGKERRTMTFLRVGLDDGERLLGKAWRFPAQLANRAPGASWVLPQIPTDEPLIMTNLDGRLLVIEIDDELRFTSVDPGPVSHPALLQTGGGLWALWLSQKTGLQAALLKAR